MRLAEASGPVQFLLLELEGHLLVRSAHVYVACQRARPPEGLAL